MLTRVWENYDSFYFIGIGGVSMSGLAKFMLMQGKKVGGSDAVQSEYTDELERLGAKIEIGKIVLSSEIIAYDAVIYTDAISPDNPQILSAVLNGKKVFSRGQFLSETCEAFKNVIAVSGCHGKTTTTSMLAHIFCAAGKKFTAHIGGKDTFFSNFFSSGEDYFITEACEYKKNFLLLKPDISVVLSCGADHLECYGSAENLHAAYIEFAQKAQKCVAVNNSIAWENSDIVYFGYDKTAQIHAENITAKGGKYSFSAYSGGNFLGNVSLQVCGRYNVLNALAAIAVSLAAGIDFKYAKLGIEDFCGVERRFEGIGKIHGAQVIADYAHHPEELSVALKTAESIAEGRLFVIFQPHTYSRTKNLFKDFVRVLSPVENLLIYRTFAAREYFDDGGSALTLSQSVKNSRYGDDIADVADFVADANENDIVLVLGAGDVYQIFKEIIRGLT